MHTARDFLPCLSRLPRQSQTRKGITGKVCNAGLSLREQQKKSAAAAVESYAGMRPLLLKSPCRLRVGVKCFIYIILLEIRVHVGMGSGYAIACTAIWLDLT